MKGNFYLTQIPFVLFLAKVFKPLEQLHILSHYNLHLQSVILGIVLLTSKENNGFRKLFTNKSQYGVESLFTKITVHLQAF